MIATAIIVVVVATVVLTTLYDRRLEVRRQQQINRWMASFREVDK